jgi:hypothetical protein
MKRRTEAESIKIFKNAVRAGQPDLFAVSVPVSHSAVGLAIQLPSDCLCGSASAAVCRGTGLYPGELKCPKCGKHRGWVSCETFRFLSGTVDRFGNPTEPVLVRAGTDGQ